MLVGGTGGSKGQLEIKTNDQAATLTLDIGDTAFVNSSSETEQVSSERVERENSNHVKFQ